jgi:hypothetical protein
MPLAHWETSALGAFKQRHPWPADTYYRAALQQALSHRHWCSFLHLSTIFFIDPSGPALMVPSETLAPASQAATCSRQALGCRAGMPVATFDELLVR